MAQAVVVFGIATCNKGYSTAVTKMLWWSVSLILFLWIRSSTSQVTLAPDTRTYVTTIAADVHLNVTKMRPLTPSEVVLPSAPPVLDASPPPLPQNYHVTIRVLDTSQNALFTVLEHGEGALLALTLTTPAPRHSSPATCLAHVPSGDGHVIRGVVCRRSSALPQSCFCGKEGCAPFVPVASLIAFLINQDAKKDSADGKGSSAQQLPAQVQEVGVDGAELWAWRATRNGVTVQAIFARADGHTLVPTAFSVDGAGKAFGLPGGPLRLSYSVTNFRGSDGPTGPWDRLGSPFVAPKGVFCPPLYPPRGRLPTLSDQLSVTMETVATWQKSLSYEEFHMDFDQKLCSFRWKPHMHVLPSTPLAAFPFAVHTMKADNAIRVVHDFRTGVQYEVNEATGNCSVEPIPPTALDAIDTEIDADVHRLRLRHAYELLHSTPDNFAYAGMREVRGVLADVWVAERETAAKYGYYATLELFFSHENWTVQVEGINRVQRAPLGVATYVAPEKDLSTFTHVAVTHFLHYRVGHPAWHHFEVEPCLKRSQRLFLRITIKESYDRFIQYSMDAAQDALRQAIAVIAGVSPLRVTNVFLQSDPEDEESCRVWFVLLDRPGIFFMQKGSAPPLALADAFQRLRSIIDNHAVEVHLVIGIEGQLSVTISRGSLATTSEGLHPVTRQRGLRYTRAAYTAGSMAGLGFSMAVLGIALGLLVGFLLWRRQKGIPYHVAD